MTDTHPIPEELLIDHLAILAKTGAGKSYGAKGIVERLLRKNLRVCIVDPKNAWWGLKSSADGKSPAFSIVVFGGPATCGKDAGGGYFRDLVGKLSGLEMVTYPRQGAVKAADWLFI